MGLFKDAWDAAASTARDTADSAADAGEDAWDATTQNAGELLPEGAGDIWEEVWGGSQDDWELLSQLGTAELEALAAEGTDLWEQVLERAEDTWQEAAGFVNDGASLFGAVAEDAWEELSRALEAAWESMARIAEDGWQAALLLVQNAWEAVERSVERAWAAASSLAETISAATVALYEASLEIIERVVLWLGDAVMSIMDFFRQLAACLAGQVVYALAKADNIALNLGRPARMFSNSFQQVAKPLFPEFPVWWNIWYVDGAHLSAHYFDKSQEAMTIGGVTWGGVVLGHLTFFSARFDESDKESRKLAVHELVHVRQQRRFILESIFACAYGAGYAKGGFDYWKNPMEIEAYSFVGANDSAI